MSDLAKFVDWVLTHPDVAKSVTGGAEDLLVALRRPPGGGPARTFTGVPSADRALAQASGLAAIAGKRGVTADQVFEVAAVLARVVFAVI